MPEDPFADVSKRRETRLQAFRDFFSGKKSKPKLGTSNGKALGTSNGKGLGSSGGLSYGSLEETINSPDAEEVRLSPVHEHVVDADNIVGEAEFYQARPFSDKKGQRIAGEFMPYREEHEPYGLRDDGIICISKAYLYEIHPINDTLIRHELAPLQISAGGDGVVYTMYKTDDHGKVKVEEAEEGEEAEPSYILGFAGDLPANTDYILPDEDGYGVEGEYYTPICYIKDSKLEAKQFQDGRQALMRGALEGHRGPLWWIAGYDAIKNVGVGQRIYKNYTEGDDFKNLRSISQLGQTRNCEGDNKVSGLPQIKVGTNGDTIHINGNRYNKTWKVGDKNQAIVEDGLVRCLSDLEVQELEPVTVFAHSTTNPTITQVAKIPTPAQKGKAYVGGALNNTMWAGGSSASNNVVVAAVVENDYVRGGSVNSQMIQGIPHNKMWSGGTEETIDYVKICVSSSSTTGGTSEICYWVLGEVATNNVAPASVTYVDSPISCVGVTSAVQITGVQDSTTTGGGVESTTLGQGIVGTNIVNVTSMASTPSSAIVEVDVIKELTGVTVVNATTTVEVLKSTGSTLRLVKESTGSNCDSCPTE